MTLISRFGLCALAASFFVVASAGPVKVLATPVGNWVGRIKFDMSQLPSSVTLKQRDEIKKRMNVVAINLSVRENRTWTLKVPAGVQGKAENAEGTWQQNGSKITIVTTKENGKKPTGKDAKPQTMTLSADGKKMTLVLPKSEGGVTILFSKA